MTKSREELLQRLAEKQAVKNTDPEIRELIGFLSASILTLGEEVENLSEEVENLQARIAELEDRERENRQRAWYRDR